jgi:hypothetical protein
MPQLPSVSTFQEFIQRHEHDLNVLRDLSLGLRDVSSTEGKKAMARVRVIARVRTEGPGLAPSLRHVPCFLTQFTLSRVQEGGVVFVQGSSGELQDDLTDPMTVLLDEHYVVLWS